MRILYVTPIIGKLGHCKTMLQSIILNQHISHSTMALMQTQMDNGFAAMKHFMQ